MHSRLLDNFSMQISQLNQINKLPQRAIKKPTQSLADRTEKVITLNKPIDELVSGCGQ